MKPAWLCPPCRGGGVKVCCREIFQSHERHARIFFELVFRRSKPQPCAQRLAVRGHLLDAVRRNLPGLRPHGHGSGQLGVSFRRRKAGRLGPHQGAGVPAALALSRHQTTLQFTLPEERCTGMQAGLGKLSGKVVLDLAAGFPAPPPARLRTVTCLNGAHHSPACRRGWAR